MKEYVINKIENRNENNINYSTKWIYKERV